MNDFNFQFALFNFLKHLQIMILNNKKKLFFKNSFFF